MRVIIIEDEKKTANELVNMLRQLDSEIYVEAILPSVSSAIKWLNENPSPELIFSDIHLGDGLSFEIFKVVGVESPVIFCTAYNEYAIKAFESNGIDYLLKPLEEDMLHKSMEKYFRFKSHLLKPNQYTNNLQRVVAEMTSAYKQNIIVNYREKIIPIRVSDIHFIYAANGSVYLHDLNANNYPLEITIELLESTLDPHQFFRANRQFMINRSSIKNIEHYFNRKLYVMMNTDTPEKIIISRIKSQLFLKWIEE